MISIATWNINSVRLRAGLVCHLLATERPDILCLQETKSPVDRIPAEDFAALGYATLIARGEKGYNGVAILSRLPLEPLPHLDFCGRGDARHVAALTPGGVAIHNLYVPAGGDEPDPAINPKFAHKLDFVAELAAWSAERTGPAILVGDLNIAPGEDDVWSHTQLLKVVSHTPVEVEAFERARGAGGWVDVSRSHMPSGKLYSWWSYRAPRLGRRGPRPPARPCLGKPRSRAARARQPYPEGRAGLDPALRPCAGLRQLRPAGGPMSDAIRLQIEGPVATITLDRPAKRNALEVADLEAFAAALVEAHAAPAVRVLVLTGRGDRAFCSGVSLGDVAGQDWSDNPLTALCDGLEQFPWPTICALNGGVYGGGAEIALACDFRIGVHGMACFVPPARLGIHYEPAGIARDMRRLGPQVTRRMFLAVETFDAEALLGCGFLDRLVPAAELVAETRGLADRLSALAPLAVRGMKQTINELAENRLDMDAARARIAEAWASDDLREGLAAMREKRAPVFRGC